MPAAELDPPEVEAWLDARSGVLAFDVGANTGRVASKLCERFTQVVAFEPADESFRQLALVERTHPNLEAWPAAISDASGALSLAVQSNHIQTGQLTSPQGGGEEWIADRSAGGGGWGEILDVRRVCAFTLDDLCARRFADPDFVKIDVEGHEGRVVTGGLSLFERARPAFYIEVHNAELGRSIRDVLSPWYPHMRDIRHPYYKQDQFGFLNHFWLVSE